MESFDVNFNGQSKITLYFNYHDFSYEEKIKVKRVN